MKKMFLIVVLKICVVSLYGQQLSDVEFLKLSLEEKVDVFFNTYMDGHTHINVSMFAGYIVFNHGYAVMPFIKERLEQANYFSFTTEPKNITLTLIAYLMASLHTYSGYEFNPEVPVYELMNDEIQWFFDEYMRRIDEYILVYRIVDEVVMNSSIDISWVTCFTTYHRGTIVEFGYPFFGDKPIKYCGNDLKRYFEERLGINDLIIDYSAFDE